VLISAASSPPAISRKVVMLFSMTSMRAADGPIPRTQVHLSSPESAGWRPTATRLPPGSRCGAGPRHKSPGQEWR
jgi:hypothetical protein